MEGSNATNGSRMGSSISKQEIEDWCIVYGIEGFITVVGNVVAILVFLLNPSLHKRTYYLLVSLAIADFLVGATAMPMFVYVVGRFFNVWKGNTDLSEAQTIVEVFTSYASIYSLTAIAIERMIAVMFPWKHSMESRTSYIAAIIITWLMAVITAIFIVFYRLKDKDVTRALFLVIMVLLSLSLLITLVCYIVISIKLLMYKQSMSSLPNREHRETELAITLLVVSIIFIITWLPFQVINYIYHFHPEQAIKSSYHYVLATKFLHYFNSLVNPFIYTFRIPEFRKGLKNLCCCFETPEQPPKNQTKGAWHVRGIDGPQKDTNPDDYSKEMSLTTV